MDCLNNYIGLDSCGSSVSDSGLYINNLAGIELKQINEIANAEQQNYIGVWDKVQARALKIFENDIKKAFRTKHNLKGVTQSINIGKLIDTTVTTAASTQLRGLAIELNEANDDFVASNLQVIQVNTVKIYVPGAETFDLKIIDLDDESELYNESQTTTAAGWLTVNINMDFLHSRRIFIGYDCSSIDSVKLDISNHELNCFEAGRSRVRGAYSTIGDEANITYNEYNTQGLSVVFSTQCKFDVVVCNNKDVFAQALLYLLGSELMLEQTTSSRLNQWTLLDNKQAKYLQGYYKAMYLGGVYDDQEFTGELKEAVNSINLDKYDYCVECSGALRFQDPLI